MLTDKELKKVLKEKCKKEPEKYYPVQTLKELGFIRKQCNCKTFFWTTNKDQNVCGDAKCSGGFRFIGQSPAKNKLDYIETWKTFAKLFSELGYTPIARYPVVARWHPTVDFTIASIVAFQPFVVSGVTPPPANPLVIPQFCLRFGDIDNVGITGSHYTGFIMIGQKTFQPKEKYEPNKYLKDIYVWLTKGMGLPKEEITFHEDAWAGNNNAGPSMEFYSRGLELGNQVYMQFEQTPEGQLVDLKLKVLDMGLGMERVPWFTQGTSTSYETTFPTVVDFLRKKTGIKVDQKTWQEFLPYANMLNVDEVENVEESWNFIAQKLKITVNDLKEKILPNAALYSIADHCRSLLFAIADGALPSNVGGMYNLRVILRRALMLIDKHRWNVNICDVCEEHAKYLKPLFPELILALPSVKIILDVEKVKYDELKKKTAEIIRKVLVRPITTEEMIELYDSQGISPETLRDAALAEGKELKIPDNFYALVAQRHEKKEVEAATKKEIHLPLHDLPNTKALYFQDWKIDSFKGKVLKIINKYVVLDQTAFYPTSGGQMHDVGTLGGAQVIDVFKQEGVIVHTLADISGLNEGDFVEGKINFERRKQLTQHHTTTHIIGAAARKVLGKHINQAGAKKDVDHAYIDLTHYQPITNEELREIEKEANKTIKAGIKTNLKFYPRTEAEKKFGMTIYQGGAVPGAEIRIIEIPKIDAQACGGTHLNNTNEAEEVLLQKQMKVKDGVVRIYFVAGTAAKKIKNEQERLLKEISEILAVPPELTVGRAKELFEKWKTARKAANKGQNVDVKQFELVSKEKFEGDTLAKLSEELNTQVEYVPKTLRRFLEELEKFKKKS
ncbi:MAG: alanine--tRNA ligase [Candidatus Aenigmarchaeota archaeon]|nr:alanine--tRNA ligase [Candidatus Aenigmarchaeota archaeon]